jgi:hypothetical protein
MTHMRRSRRNRDALVVDAQAHPEVRSKSGATRLLLPDSAAADAVERCALGSPQESGFMAIANVLEA